MAANEDTLRVSLLVVFILMVSLSLFTHGKVPREMRLFCDLDPALHEEREDDFLQKIKMLEHRYHLTARESDIVALYARGRSRAYIAESLIISENTVRDHLRNVYKKMKIHNKQELLDALQD